MCIRPMLPKLISYFLGNVNESWSKPQKNRNLHNLCKYHRGKGMILLESSQFYMGLFLFYK